MFIVKYRKIWFSLSSLMIALSFYAMFAYGFNFSIDFKGGTLTEINFPEGRPDKTVLETEIEELSLGGFSVRPVEGDGFVVRTRELTEPEKDALSEQVSIHGEYVAEVERSNTIGPIAGAELRSKAVIAVLIVVLMIVLFITFAFRKVSRPISSWKYGFATIIALAHDIIIPTGVFVFLGHLAGVEIDLLFVTGLLAILGYSVHDTIVVFDRVRENLRLNQERGAKEEFEETVGKAVTQTMGRSINTSLTLLITLVALYLLGSSATESLSLLLIVGVIVGAYSSIFIGSPLLITLYNLQTSKKA